MNFINRAYKNVTRRYSKSILLILTFFLIGEGINRVLSPKMDANK